MSRVSVRPVRALLVTAATALVLVQAPGTAIGSAAASGAVAANGSATAIGHGAVELDALKAALDRRWTKVPDAVAGWYVDHRAGKVAVEVVGDDPEALSFAATAARDPGVVRIDRVAQRPRPLWNIVGGDPLFIGSSSVRCALGFNARNSSGTRFVLAAGHCTRLGGNASGVGGPIGPVVSTSFPGNDFGLIQVTSAAAVSTPLVRRGAGTVTVAGSAGVPVGGSVCRSGPTTGWHCGTVQALNQTVNYGGGQIVSGLTRTNVCAEPGDSGGPFVSNPGAGTRVQAQGLTSGGSGNCSTGGTTFFQPVNEALSFYGLTLVTG